MKEFITLMKEKILVLEKMKYKRDNRIEEIKMQISENSREI